MIDILKEHLLEKLWYRRAKILRVIDGDTIEVEIDQGLHDRRVERLRLLGVNCPETRGETAEAGWTAKLFTAEWVTEDGPKWPLVIHTEKGDSFGRWLAMVWRVSDGRCLNDDLLATGHAVPFTK